MAKHQFYILYREFLFRLVDRDVLSVSAQGDASRLLGRLVSLLIVLSIPFALLIIGLGNSQLSHDELLVTAWGSEDALIATTMLLVGLFSVLSWNSTYPDRRDVLVLGPLPVQASTIFFSKLAALAVALSLTVLIFNAASFIVLPLAFAPRDATPLDLLFSIDTYRLAAAFWITLFASGAFILCSVLAAQGVLGLLPRSLYLRASAFLQLTAFCLFLTGYFLQPSLTSLKSSHRDTKLQHFDLLPFVLVPRSLSAVERLGFWLGTFCTCYPRGARMDWSRNKYRDSEHGLCFVLSPHPPQNCGASGHRAQVPMA